MGAAPTIALAELATNPSEHLKGLALPVSGLARAHSYLDEAR
jgi:hypothetical protein